MWKFPWRFKEGFTICAGIILTGIFLNGAVGEIVPKTMSFPLNIIIGICYLILLILISWLLGRNKYLNWFSGQYAAISAIVSFLVLAVIMGLTRQATNETALIGFGAILKFTSMLNSWAFGLMLIYLTSVLGLTTIRRLSKFNYKKDIPFVLNHAGLFIALTAGTLGNGDMHRLQMAVTASNPEWRAMNEEQKIVELSLAIQLDSFIIEEYPPKIMMLQRDDKEPEITKEENILIIEKIPATTIMHGYEIEVEKSLPMAAPYNDSDTAFFVPFNSLGATHALKVNILKPGKGLVKSGWLSCGNYLHQPRYIFIDSNLVLVMPQPEIKRYTSKVTVFEKSGNTHRATIQVNKPYNLNKWKIYQLSYDQTKGRWSNVSILELICDPWLPLVYTGFFMMMGGALMLLFGKQKSTTNELE